MQVILQENVEKLGTRGEVVNVAKGYARNYLLPRKLALEASAGNLKRLEKIRFYLQNRLHMMFYDELRAEDLEVASGVGEGAVRHVIGKRFDNGSMRWIRERAEALLQLRCIEINGDWDAFIAFTRAKLFPLHRRDVVVARLLTSRPSSLPTSVVAA